MVTQTCLDICVLMFPYIPYHPQSTYEISILHSHLPNTIKEVVGIALTTAKIFNPFLILPWLSAIFYSRLCSATLICNIIFVTAFSQAFNFIGSSRIIVSFEIQHIDLLPSTSLGISIRSQRRLFATQISHGIFLTTFAKNPTFAMFLATKYYRFHHMHLISSRHIYSIPWG